MKLAIAFGKVAALAGWTWGILSFLVPRTVPEPSIGKMVFLGLLAVHAGEAFAFAKALTAEHGGSLRGHVGKIMIFGYFHVLGIRYG